MDSETEHITTAIIDSSETFSLFLCLKLNCYDDDEKEQKEDDDDDGDNCAQYWGP